MVVCGCQFVAVHRYVFKCNVGRACFKSEREGALLGYIPVVGNSYLTAVDVQAADVVSLAGSASAVEPMAVGLHLVGEPHAVEPLAVGILDSGLCEVEIVGDRCAILDKTCDNILLACVRLAVDGSLGDAVFEHARA